MFPEDSLQLFNISGDAVSNADYKHIRGAKELSMLLYLQLTPSTLNPRGAVLHRTLTTFLHRM